MAGRKTIMVDGGVWNKVEELKHNAYLRSSSDAIETAVDIASSDKYYAGIMAQYDSSEEIAYVVESLGKTEDEAVRNLLIFEQDSVFGEVRAEDIPTADETDITKPGRFIVECSKRLYHAGKLFADPEDWSDPSSIAPGTLFTCTISKSKNGSLIADSEETAYCKETEVNTNIETSKYFVLVQFMDDAKTARIIDYGTSPIKLHKEILYEANSDSYESEEKYDCYNACNYTVFPCTPRLYAECIGMMFQSRSRLYLEKIVDLNIKDEPQFQAFYGHLKAEFKEKTGVLYKYLDTTPEGKYYAVLAKPKKDTYFVYNAAETANKASKPLLCKPPVQYNDLGDGEHYKYETVIPVWSEVNENGERVGKYELDENTTVDLVLVECTKELYCKFIMAGEKLKVPCTVEVENGVKIAKCLEETKQAPSEKTPAAKTTKAKKTGGKK